MNSSGKSNYQTVDEYLTNFGSETLKKLQAIRKTVQQVAPEATEKISYGIPTFVLRGNLVHFAGYKTHIGFYPGAAPIKQFAKELSGYKTSKGTVQFPIHQPLPLDLIKKITKFRVEQNR